MREHGDMSQHFPGTPFIACPSPRGGGGNISDEFSQPPRGGVEPVGEPAPLVILEVVQKSPDLAFGELRTLDPHPMSLRPPPCPPPQAGGGTGKRAGEGNL